MFPLTEALTTENRILFDEHIFSLHIYEMEKVVDPDFINQNVSGLGVGKELFGQFYDLLPVVLLISVQEMPLFMRC